MPDGHAASVPLQSEDCAGLVALCPMDTKLPAPLRPDGSLRIVGAATGEHCATAPLRPEDRAGLVALRSVDALPPIRCDPMDHCGRVLMYP